MDPNEGLDYISAYFAGYRFGTQSIGLLALISITKRSPTVARSSMLGVENVLRTIFLGFSHATGSYTDLRCAHTEVP